MSISVLVVVALLLMLVLLWLTERDTKRFVFSLASFALLAALIGLLLGDFERSILLATLLAVAVVALSKVKFHHSARALIVADAPLLFAGTVPFFFTQYRSMMTAVVCGGVASCAAAVAAMTVAAGAVWPFEARLGTVAVASAICVTTYRLNGGLVSFRRSVTEPAGAFSTFAASIADLRSWWRVRSLNAAGIAERGLTLKSPVEREAEIKPHIILIQHESVFDPRVFGLSVTSDVDAFLKPVGGRSGILEAEIFGGGSWQSEFSVLTGIPSGLFGTDAYFLFQRGVGCFKHSLATELKRLGYGTSLISSCRRGFLNYDAFYGAIGMDRLVFSDDLPLPFDVDAFEQTFSDTQFLPAAMQDVLALSEGSTDAQFFYVLTNFNHGPHNRQLASRRLDQQRTLAKQALGDAEYAEYYARLAETAEAWAGQREQIAALARQRPIVVMHYGDHQPVLTRRIEALRGMAAESERSFRTFFAIETFGAPGEMAIPDRLPIAYVQPVLLQAAGLSLDAINATRAELLTREALGRGEDEARLLRTLVDMDLVDLD